MAANYTLSLILKSQYLFEKMFREVLYMSCKSEDLKETAKERGAGNIYLFDSIFKSLQNITKALKNMQNFDDTCGA